MDRSHFIKYQAYSGEELREELIERCRRLRRPRPDVSAGAPASPALRGIRCRLTPEHADSDWPSMLEAERRAQRLLATLHEVVVLLGRFDPFGRAPGRGTRPPS